MFNFLNKIFGTASETDFAELVATGAKIIDVRTPEEYKSGHINGAINIPLNTLAQHFTKFKKDTPIITCCASGMRSASAKNVLTTNGFNKVYNGGGWQSLQSKLDQPKSFYNK